ncbi:hypothetical protein PINS_up016066 [Pythium insidiosum]|nr:hypothetical protein PINS_up016066 [Pythium insidiosum]
MAHRMSASATVVAHRRKTRTGLLPSLFSNWTLHAKIESTNGAGLAIVAPQRLFAADGSAPPSGLPEFNLIADMSVVLVRAASSLASAAKHTSTFDESNISAARAATACCGPNAFRASRAQCLSCPAGSNATLFGYTCV